MTTAELGVPSEPVNVKLPAKPACNALVRRPFPTLQFGSMKPLSCSPDLLASPIVEIPHAPVTLDPARLPPVVASCFAAENSPQPTQPDEKASAAHFERLYTPCKPADSDDLALALLPDPTSAHEACAAIQTAGPPPTTSVELEDTSRPTSGIPHCPKRKLTEKKPTSFYKRCPCLSKGSNSTTNKPVSLKPLTTVPHHPVQISRDAVTAFSFASKNLKPESKTPPLKQLKPITCYSSYKAYEAASALSTHEEACIEIPLWLGEHLQSPMGGVYDRSSDHQAPNSAKVVAKGTDEQPDFIAARLPAFDDQAFPSEPSLSTESLIIGPLFEPPSPLPEKPVHLSSAGEAMTAVANCPSLHAAKDKTACTLYRGKPGSVLDSSSFNLKAFCNISEADAVQNLDVRLDDLTARLETLTMSGSGSRGIYSESKAKDKEELAAEEEMHEVCKEFDTCLLDETTVKREEELLNQRANNNAYSFKYADLSDDWDDDTVRESKDELSDVPLLIEYDHVWDGDGWTVLSSDLTPDSTNEAASDLETYDIESPQDLGRKLSSAFASRHDLDAYLAVHMPLPESPSTASLVKEDTELAQKLLAEYDESFVQLAGLVWGGEDDETAVLVEKKQPQSPFGCFPIIDGVAFGEEGMML